ncbi:MAG TPA: biotin/lipoyl-containing protein [Anaerolineales bacterium]|nr:biotin/lipoyl-containing protein [Anaerolineales bacterium]
MKYVATIEDREFLVEIVDEHHVIVDGVQYNVDFDSVSDQPVFSLLLDGQSFESYVYTTEEGLQVLLHGNLYQATVEDEREKRLRAASGGRVAEREEFHLRAPMPGLVVSIPVHEGQQIEKGDVLVILESMKMQNELKSPRAGTVARLRIENGDSVEQRQTLLSVV